MQRKEGYLKFGKGPCLIEGVGLVQWLTWSLLFGGCLAKDGYIDMHIGMKGNVYKESEIT